MSSRFCNKKRPDLSIKMAEATSRRGTRSLEVDINAALDAVLLASGGARESFANRPAESG